MVDRSKVGLCAVLAAGFAALTASLLFVGAQLQDLAAKDPLGDAERLHALVDARIGSDWVARESALKLMAQEQVDSSIDKLISKAKQPAARPAAAAPAPKAQPAGPVPPVSASDHLRGARDARITLVEYSDTECPFCKTFHATAQQIVKDYAGQVNWVYRHFPLAFHNPGATQQAVAAECAAEIGGGEAFWRYIDAIYARTRSNNGFPATALVPLAEEQGIDTARFMKCLDENKHASRVESDMQGGIAAGVRGTPGNFLIDNKTGRIVSINGAQPYGSVKAAIDSLLKDL